MPRKLTNLQTDLLRTFVTAVDLGIIPRPDRRLAEPSPRFPCRSAAWKSSAAARLIVHQGKELTLTEDGHALIGYAREILRLNDSAVARLAHSSIQGVLRVGLPIDYATGFFQTIISEFVAANPGRHPGHPLQLEPRSSQQAARR